MTHTVVDPVISFVVTSHGTLYYLGCRKHYLVLPDKRKLYRRLTNVGNDNCRFGTRTEIIVLKKMNLSWICPEEFRYRTSGEHYVAPKEAH
jgi:hypothetical protein